MVEGIREWLVAAGRTAEFPDNLQILAVSCGFVYGTVYVNIFVNLDMF